MINEKIRILFISGAGRSGSTLLEKMLGSSEHFTAAGEMIHLLDRGFLQNQRCSCGDSFKRCVFWGKVIREMESEIGKIDPKQLLHTANKLKVIKLLPLPVMKVFIEKDPELQKYLNAISAVYHAIFTVSRGRFIIDSSKNPWYQKTLKLNPQFDLYVIHLVRDSRAVAYSWTRKKVRPEFNNQVIYFKTYHPFNTAIRWMMRKNLATEMINHHHDKFLRMRYEDLAANPKCEVDRAFKFTGQQNDIGPNFTSPSCFNQDKILHSVSGNPIRFSTGDILVKPDDRWKTELRPFLRHGVTVLSAPYLMKYGYLRKTNNLMANKQSGVN